MNEYESGLLFQHPFQYKTQPGLLPLVSGRVGEGSRSECGAFVSS